ncbi:hypothetical protein I4U23_023606 [Adineta vaga]|nr:hypothetical protein I4U23_023606 [Adineta vaga]
MPVCTNPNCLQHGEAKRRLKLVFEYIDEKHDIDLEHKVQSPPTRDIHQIIEDLLRLLLLDDISPEEVRLVGFTRGNRYVTVTAKDKHRSLEKLGVTDGCILHFKPTENAAPPKQCQLTISGPDEKEKINFSWYREKTTLKELLEYVIRNFSLQQIDRECIHLFTMFDELDLKCSSLRLVFHGLYDKMSIYVRIVSSLSSANLHEDTDVHVECSDDDEKFILLVPYRERIDTLKIKIQDRYDFRPLVNFTLRNEANEEISLIDDTRTLQSIGIKPGHTIYATFRIQSERTRRLPTATIANNQVSSDLNVQDDKLTIICNFPTEDPVTTQLSVKDTFDRLIKYIDSQINHRRLVISKISSDNIRIEIDEDRSRCFADLGFKPNDVIHVVTKDKSPVHRSIVSKQSSPLTTPDTSRKSTHPKKRPIGLVNLGNSCYMNSAFQCLAHIPQLTSFFLENIDHAHLNSTKDEHSDFNPYDEVGDVIGAYADLLWNLWRCDQVDHGGHSFKPTRIKERMGEKDARFGTKDQQDAQEFMSFFLETIHRELKLKNKNDRNTIIKKLFFGEITSTITCMKCRKQESTTHPISFLSIPLNRQERTFWINYIPKNGEDITAFIDIPLNAQVGHVVEMFATHVKEMSLFHYILALLPDGEVDFRTPLKEILTDELVFMEQENRTDNKRPKPLDLPKKKSTLENCLEDFFSPELLDDERICSQDICKQKTTAMKQLKLHTLPTVLIIQFKRFSHENGLHQKIQTFVDYPLTGLQLNQFLSSSSSENAIYDLIAVCHHVGGVSGGHYTACAQHSISNKTNWYTFDDSSVNLIEKDDYKYDIVSRDAYLLFYIKRDSF